MGRSEERRVADNLDVPPNYPPPLVEKFGECARQLFNKRDASDASNNNTATAVAARPTTRELPLQPDTCIDAALYIKLKKTLEIIFV